MSDASRLLVTGASVVNLGAIKSFWQRQQQTAHLSLSSMKLAGMVALHSLISAGMHVQPQIGQTGLIETSLDLVYNWCHDEGSAANLFMT